MLALFAFAVAGCYTTRKRQGDLETQGLRNQVAALQSQLQVKEEEINALRESASKTSSPVCVNEKSEFGPSSAVKKEAVCRVKTRPNVRQIQVALKNAGYDSGLIDGKLGRQTTDAIKAFQKANNLKADGRVGKNTWEILKQYLEKKVK
jgi:peptidoglycan hydrolase-like protein with peptidoglycan-binding domain